MNWPFPPADRVRSRSDFQRIHESSLFAADGVLVVRAALNSTGRTRLGLTVGRQVGGAVVRNRWKRLIREAFRLSRPQLPPGLDLVVRPKKGASPDFVAIQNSLRQLARRVHRQLTAPGKTP